jgi:transcriptional regulator with XRE-family HTH domain
MAKRRRYSDEHLGPTIEQLMVETGTTYRGLADRADLSAGYLNHIVHGNRPVPSNEVLARIANALDVEPEHFREYRIRHHREARADARAHRPPVQALA